MVLKSKKFDDVYFSAEDGLAETRHVFINGNNLPDAWAGKPHFTIAETGFGTGLNFLATWRLFEETASPEQSLVFISFEKYPLVVSQISEALACWSGEFGGKISQLCESYPGCGQITENISLRLITGDVNDELPKLDTSVDCWFLDGFKPATNPDMWSDTVFENMTRLSKPSATFATFTAAGFVRRGLQEAGFTVQKVPGFGRKREMLVGCKC